MEVPKIELELNRLFDELHTQQMAKVLRIAKERLPHLTADDILNPHDFPELMVDPIFNYEEGIASGLLAAQMAVRARLNESDTECEDFFPKSDSSW